MIVKVCGIRTTQNLDYLSQSNADWIGFIFFGKSKRNFLDGDISPEQMQAIEKVKVGVFVNESLDMIAASIETYALDMVQLHGDESNAFCEQVKHLGVEVMKAFSVQDELPSNLNDYVGAIDFVLFDTKGAERGGNGVQFDWSILESYRLNMPFLVSGGIGVEDVSELKKIKNKKMAGIDINSRFELEPGLKDEQLLEQFIHEFKS